MVLIGFSTSRRWNAISALIRAMTNSRMSHSWLMVEDPLFKTRLVLEAHSVGFRLVSFTRFVEENEVIALVKPAHSLEPGLPSTALWLGEKFDLLGLFGIFLTLVGRLFRQRPWLNPFPTARPLYCTKAVVRSMKAARYPGSEELGDHTTSPADLFAFFREDPANVVYENRAFSAKLEARVALRAIEPAQRKHRAEPDGALAAGPPERSTSSMTARASAFRG
jgi:hypothetical protein